MKGYTRASALGPIADFVDSRGGSIERIFNRADLPLALLDNPDCPVPLTEQFKVLHEAGRDIGDPFLGASLGRLVSMKNLSAFGAWVSEAPTLAGAIDRSHRGLNRYMQTGTRLDFRVEGTRARWSIEFFDRGGDGRFQNDLLGVSYLMDGVRYFVGPGWSPIVVHSTCTGAAQASRLERIFEAPVIPNAPVSAIEFDVALLATPGRPSGPVNFEVEPPIPSSFGVRSEVAALAGIALLEGHPKIDWVAGKLNKSRRSLQRALDREGCRFSDVVDGLIKDRALLLMQERRRGVTEIAHQLGYSDSAHFTRAFRRWTGQAPSHYRAALAV